MSTAAELLPRPGYEDDFHAWALDQAERLRAFGKLRSNEPIDWEQLAEEVEDLGKSERHACESFVEQIIAHLLKLEHSAAIESRRGWVAEVAAARVGLERKLSPSIRRHLQSTLAGERFRFAMKLLQGSLKLYEPETLARIPAKCPYSWEQITGDWWPEERP